MVVSAFVTSSSCLFLHPPQKGCIRRSNSFIGKLKPTMITVPDFVRLSAYTEEYHENSSSFSDYYQENTSSFSYYRDEDLGDLAASAAAARLDDLAASAAAAASASSTIPRHRPPPHHVAIRTRDIETAIGFYSLFGFEVQHKFRAGSARAAWIVQEPVEVGAPPLRIELIEIPNYILDEQPGARARAVDLLARYDLLGYNHLALDVTHFCCMNRTEENSLPSLSDYIYHLNFTSQKIFGKTIRIALPPKQTMIGNDVYELAYIFDADGCLLELLNYQTTITTWKYEEEILKWWQQQSLNNK